MPVDCLNVSIGEHTNEIQGIDTQVEQGSSAEVWAEDTLLASHAVAQGCSNKLWFTDTSLCYQAFHDTNSWLIARPDCLGEEHTVLVSHIDYLLSLA